MRKSWRVWETPVLWPLQKPWKRWRRSMRRGPVLAGRPAGISRRFLDIYSGKTSRFNNIDKEALRTRARGIVFMEKAEVPDLQGSSLQASTSQVSALRWENGSLVLLDQTRLPEEEVYLVCRDHREVAAAIRRLAVRGAPAIGVAAAFGVVLGAR